MIQVKVPQRIVPLLMLPGFLECQATGCCPIAWNCCIDGNCCQPNTYCGLADNGIIGCCDNGQICTGSVGGPTTGTVPAPVPVPTTTPVVDTTVTTPTSSSSSSSGLPLFSAAGQAELYRPLLVVLVGVLVVAMY